ncbi:hypothetical protein CMESO_250 (nucleomorph) [Chroomonas mesostigmatica CCMP1168]|uniref:Uncharacterized protein n=1 Tax=Chroomonas mesostigmatica CCMP1168 TaxID=1195612 RepID=J7G800_9CRYP|nr:hypothetical protein CMESO_250 [Chroomonas mesostigmatica CCMP1168]
MIIFLTFFFFLNFILRFFLREKILKFFFIFIFNLKNKKIFGIIFFSFLKYNCWISKTKESLKDSYFKKIYFQET